MYFNEEGDVHRPGLEIELESHDDKYNLLTSMMPLTPTNLSTPWRFVIQTAIFLLKLARIVHGEHVLEYFSAHDNSFFGSIYVRGGKDFLSLHAHDQKSIMKGIAFLTS